MPTSKNIRLIRAARAERNNTRITDDLISIITTADSNNSLDYNILDNIDLAGKKLLLLLFKLLSAKQQLDIDKISKYIHDLSSNNPDALQNVKNQVVQYIQEYISPTLSLDPEMQQKILQNVTNWTQVVALKEKWQELNASYVINSWDHNGFFNILISNEDAISLLKKLQQEYVYFSYEQDHLQKFAKLLSVADTASALNEILESLLIKDLLHANGELFDKLLNVENINNFATLLNDWGKSGLTFNKKTIDLLLSTKEPSSLVLFWQKLRNKEYVDDLTTIKGIDLKIQELYNDLSVSKKKLILMLCNTFLENDELGFNLLEKVITQVANPDTDLIYLIMPYMRDYLGDNPLNIQVVSNLLERVDMQLIQGFKELFLYLIDRNIITTENQLGQKIFDSIIKQSSPISTIIALSDLKYILFQLGLSGRMSSNDDNLIKLLTKIDDVAKVYEILQFFRRENLINISNAQKIFDQVINLENINEFAKVLNDLAMLGLKVTEKTLDLLLNTKEPSSLVLFLQKLHNKEFVDDLPTIQGIEPEIKELYKNLPENKRKLILMLSNISLASEGLNFNSLIENIKQVATSSDSDLIYLIMPYMRGYLGDNPLNIQVIYNLLGSSLDEKSVDILQRLFGHLIAENIITAENQLGQEIFNSLIKQLSPISTIIALNYLYAILSQLNLLGSSSSNSVRNLIASLNKIDDVQTVYEILQFFQDVELINTSNAQLIFNQIIKLPNIKSFYKIMESISNSSFKLQPQMLMLLLKLPDIKQQQDLVNMWKELYTNTELPLEFVSYIMQKGNSFKQPTKKKFQGQQQKTQQLVLKVCRALIAIDMPVDFNLFSILVDASRANLAILFKQLSNPDIIAVQGSFEQLVKAKANLQFLAVYTKAVNQKLHHIYEQALPQFFKGDLESAMRAVELKKAYERLGELQSTYGPLLQRYGSIEAVEKKIREKLLAAILEEQKGAKNAISDFINLYGVSRLAECASEPQHELTIKMRELFSSNEYPSPQIAWRSYDPIARGSRQLSSFFVSNRSDQTIFSTQESLVDMSEVGVGIEPEINNATLYVRKIAALAFLASQDERLDPATQEGIWQDFVNYMADIRRESNKTNKEIDNPSCFPGTISRIAHIVDKHPKFPPVGDHKTVLMIKDHVRDYVNVKLKELLGQLSNDKKKLLYYGLIFMDDLDKIILNPDSIFTILPDEVSPQEKQQIIDKYMHWRIKFFNLLSKGVVEYVSNKLKASGIKFSKHEIDYLINISLVNIRSLLSIRLEEIGIQNAPNTMLQQDKEANESLQSLLIPNDLPIPDNSAIGASNPLVAITSYHIPQLQLQVYAKLEAIINDHQLRIEIINELFAGLRTSVTGNPAIELLIANLREKDIAQVFNHLEQEIDKETEGFAAKMAKIVEAKSKSEDITKVVQLVCDAYQPPVQTSNSTINSRATPIAGNPTRVVPQRLRLGTLTLNNPSIRPGSSSSNPRTRRPPRR